MSGDYRDADYLEQVYAALFAAVSGAQFPADIIGFASFVSALRAVDVPDNVPTGAQPALYFVQGAMHGTQRQVFGPTKWELDAFLTIYIRADGAVPVSRQLLPDTVVNLVVWGIFQTLSPDDNKNTLGNLVHHAWIEGPVVPMVSDLDGQIVIAVPVKVLI